MQEGDTKVLSTTNLSASDGTQDADQLVFIVTSAPRFGQLSFVDANDTAITAFTQVGIDYI